MGGKESRKGVNVSFSCLVCENQRKEKYHYYILISPVLI